MYLSFRKYITRMLETQGEMVRFFSRQKKNRDGLSNDGIFNKQLNILTESSAS